MKWSRLLRYSHLIILPRSTRKLVSLPDNRSDKIVRHSTACGVNRGGQVLHNRELAQGNVREEVLHSGKLVLGHVRAAGIKYSTRLVGNTDISS